MSTVTVLNGQTIFDIAIQSCGNVESAYDIALLNDIDVFSDLESGKILRVPDVINKQVVKIFEQKKPASTPAYFLSQNQVDITYSDLVFLRNNGILQPGQFYNITDYETTTTQKNTRAAGHRFNIIVQAVSNCELSETANVCAISSDSHFNDCKLTAWQIKYCLDNDTSHFAWADTVNGKGVIYHMCDENGNSAPYDFKNILFGDNYTFELSGEDFSLNGIYCRNNVIRPYVVNGVQMLNGNLCNNLYEGECSGNFFDYNCHDNYLVDNCFNNTFGQQCSGNMLYYGCNNNAFGVNCNSNILDESCSNNYFMADCRYNELGVMCHDNMFNPNCYNNIMFSRSTNNYFEAFCRYNTMCRACHKNSFGASCSNNNLGNNAIENSFGAGCQSNVLGNNYKYNSYGDRCSFISFRYNPDINAMTVDYVQNCHISAGCIGIVVYTRPNSSEILQNVMVKESVSGTLSKYEFITIMEYNSEYEIIVERNESGEIVISRG